MLCDNYFKKLYDHNLFCLAFQPKNIAISALYHMQIKILWTVLWIQFYGLFVYL